MNIYIRMLLYGLLTLLLWSCTSQSNEISDKESLDNNCVDIGKNIERVYDSYWENLRGSILLTKEDVLIDKLRICVTDSTLNGHKGLINCMISISNNGKIVQVLKSQNFLEYKRLHEERCFTTRANFPTHTIYRPHFFSKVSFLEDGREEDVAITEYHMNLANGLAYKIELVSSLPLVK